MSFESDLCKILYHDWVKKDEWNYCDRCDKKWNYNEDWDEYCSRGKLSQAGMLLLEGVNRKR